MISATTQRPPLSPNVGLKSLQGGSWTIVFSLFGKAVSFGAQIILAYLLAPRDFGLMAMATSVSMIAGLVTVAGLRDILIQRQAEFEKTASNAFWLGLAVNGFAAILVLLIAPLGAAYFKEPMVTGLAGLSVCTIPLTGLTTIYSASLYIQLRFKAIAQVAFIQGVVQTISTVLLAKMGLGAYAIAIGVYPGAIYSVIALRVLSGRIPISRPTPRQWANLYFPGLSLTFSSFISALHIQGCHLVVGRFFGAETTGLYFWAFQISTQALYLLALNLNNVFFSSFSKLNSDSARQLRAFGNATVTMSAIVAPICVVQGLLADDLIPLIFDAKWFGAIKMVFWLSIGLINFPLFTISSARLKAQGRFTAVLVQNIIVGAGILGVCTVSCFFGSRDSFFISIGLTSFLLYLLASGIAFGHSRSGLLYVFDLQFPVLLAAIGALFIGISIRSWCSELAVFFRVAIVFTSATVAYLLLLSMVRRSIISQICSRFEQIWEPIRIRIKGA